MVEGEKVTLSPIATACSVPPQICGLFGSIVARAAHSTVGGSLNFSAYKTSNKEEY
jgi:hypothetical protein